MSLHLVQSGINMQRLKAAFLNVVQVQGLRLQKLP